MVLVTDTTISQGHHHRDARILSAERLQVHKGSHQIGERNLREG